jgi:hypothetical protein
MRRKVSCVVFVGTLAFPFSDFKGVLSDLIFSKEASSVSIGFWQAEASEFVRKPRGEIIHVLVSASFLEKLAGIKVGVDGNEGDVAVDVPLQLSLWLTPYISGCAVITGSDKGGGIVVNSIMNTLAPKEIPV